MPSPRLGIEDCAFGDDGVKHLLQRNGLRTQLHLISSMWLGMATFKFNRNWFHLSVEVIHLNQIGYTEDPEPERANRQGSNTLCSVARLTARSVGCAVKNPTFCSEPVFGPLLLDMDERALPWAIQEML